MIPIVGQFLPSLKTARIIFKILIVVTLPPSFLISLDFPLPYFSLESQFFQLPLPLDEEHEIHSEIFHSPEVFKENYAQMERKFKVFVYPLEEDEEPHTLRKLTGKYASEEYFFKNIKESRFFTSDPEQAHLYFIPFSCHKTINKGDSFTNMTSIFEDYVQNLILRYPYWNRTLGADHFLVNCHYCGVKAAEGVPLLRKNSIRVMCSQHYNSDYIPYKDIALPQVWQSFALPAGGNDLENRTSLALWTGYHNSELRDQLAHYWNIDELEVLPRRRDKRNSRELSQTIFYRNKFCICFGGSQGNLVQIADSIHYGCVPVIMSDYYILPFHDILNWQKFSVIHGENDFYKLRFVLKDIVYYGKFIDLHRNTVKAQKHFQWNTPPIKYDAFHMVMYELWLRHYAVKYQ